VVITKNSGPEMPVAVGIEISVEGNGKKEIVCKKISCVKQLLCDWYNYCVQIRCQDTTSENRMLVCVCNSEL
jgi:hypothetical protein